jgi:hypothetical protein
MHGADRYNNSQIQPNTGDADEEENDGILLERRYFISLLLFARTNERKPHNGLLMLAEGFQG